MFLAKEITSAPSNVFKNCLFGGVGIHTHEAEEQIIQSGSKKFETLGERVKDVV
jgi:hypothetical protein